MKLRIIIFSLVIFIISQFSFSPNPIEINKIMGSYSGKYEYSYVRTFENGNWRIYIYDGSVLIDRYLIED